MRRGEEEVSAEAIGCSLRKTYDRGVTSELVGTILAAAATGDGILRLEGKVVFVPGALPGEKVAYRITRPGASSDRAELLSVLEPCGRRPSPCPHDHTGGCGGCSLLHATRAASAEIKRQLVRDAMVRVGGIDADLVGECLMPGPDLGYRNHVRFQVDGQGRMAFVKRGRHMPGRDHPVIAITSCAVVHPRVEFVKQALEGMVRDADEVEIRVGTQTNDSLAILHGVETLPRGIDPANFPGSLSLGTKRGLVPVRGLSLLHEVVGGVRFRISAASFFQINTAGAEELLRLVKEALPQKDGPRAILDLYAGVGLFAIAATLPTDRVIATELEPSAAKDFRVNVVGRDKILFKPLDVGELLRDLTPGRDFFDAAIVDPPRAGVETRTLLRLAALRIPRLIMVSCDAGSLARDLRAITSCGYVVRSVTPVDQFPGTPHVEVVAICDLT